MIDRTAAEQAIGALFAQYKSQVTAADQAVMQALSDGKLYELFVLAEVVRELDARGCRLTFQGATLKFKAGPDMLKTSDPHFLVQIPSGHTLWLFVDIEFNTLGHQLTAATDLSRRHEVDIMLVQKNAGYPNHDDIWLAVECKAVANFGKDLAKEVLGVRRELSMLTGSQPSKLTQYGGHPPIDVPANPPSEFWLAHIDPKGSNYAQSPAAFGIDLRHLDP